MKNNERKIKQIISLLQAHIKTFNPTLTEIIIKEYGKNPFLILISCLLSLRTKDTTTIHVCRNLFKKIKTPKEFINTLPQKLEKIIFKTGFYKNKTKVLLEVSKIIHQKYNDKVPNSLEKLLSIKGIGRKTANPVLGYAFNIPRICVDTHVHRISNRLGIINTKNTEETEYALEKILPQKNWIKWNKYLVIWGQNICTPRTPKCTRCALKKLCKHVINASI